MWRRGKIPSLDRESHQTFTTNMPATCLHRTGLGRLLMSFLETVAENIPEVHLIMLTCFLSNKNGLEFYRTLGFEKAPHSPEPRKLRFGKMFTPDYMIMSKEVVKKRSQIGTGNERTGPWSRARIESGS